MKVHHGPETRFIPWAVSCLHSNHSDLCVCVCHWQGDNTPLWTHVTDMCFEYSEKSGSYHSNQTHTYTHTHICPPLNPLSFFSCRDGELLASRLMVNSSEKSSGRTVPDVPQPSADGWRVNSSLVLMIRWVERWGSPAIFERARRAADDTWYPLLGVGKEWSHSNVEGKGRRYGGVEKKSRSLLLP